MGASGGLVTGKVKIVLDPSDTDKVEDGDILVTTMTNPLFVPAMRRAAAIVTDVGGQLSHAAIVAREFGIPCVVATGNATTVLSDGMEVTVDGTSGLVNQP